MRIVSWICAMMMLAASTAWGAKPPPVAPFETPGTLTGENPLDSLVLNKLKEQGLQSSYICSDAVFVRRVYLDIIGTLPTVEEAKEFLADRKFTKRRALIDHLLDRPEFADYWALKWADLLRIKAEFPINLWPNAVQTYHRWVRTAVKDNMPYDRFARELLTSSGSNFRKPTVNFYRALQSKNAETIAQTVALTFMGMRAENWPKERMAGLAAFFGQVGYKSTGEWKEEIVFFDPAKGGGVPKTATCPDGTVVNLSGDRDPREDFADWLISAKNPYFAKNIVNRVWSWLVGRGIVHEPDDMRPDNPPANPELLAFLEKELVASKYDLKHIYRLILNSRTYQLSSISQNGKRANGETYFATYPLRRLEAEVLIDALCQITGTTEKYSSPIPEPYTYIPEDHRSIALADGSITSTFLELFGRPPRDSGLESERSNRPTAAQRLHLLNSGYVQRKLEQSKTIPSLNPNSKWGSATVSTDSVNKIYLMVLSRLPTDEEMQAVTTYVRYGKLNGRDGAIDLTWALINSAEFLYRH